MRLPEVILSFTLIGSSLAMCVEEVLVDVVKWRHLQVLNIFHCLNHEQGINPTRLTHTLRDHHTSPVSFVYVPTFSEPKFVTSIESVLSVRVGLIVDMSCRGVESVLHVLAERRFFNGERYSWLLVGLRALEANRQALQNLSITVASNVLLVQPVGAEGECNFAILDAYGQWTMESWRLSLLQIASWSRNTGLEIWDRRTPYQRRLNLYGMPLGGVLEEVRCQNCLEGEQDYNNQQPLRILVDPLAIEQTDVERFDYVAAVGASQTILLFIHPDVDRTRHAFLRPFSLLLWTAIAVLFVLFALLLYKILTLEWSLDAETDHTNVRQKNENGIWILVLGIFCQQGFIERTEWHASRITLYSMLIFTVLIYQFYLTHIVSFLLVVPPKNINTLKQLVDNGFSVAVENAPDIVEFVNGTDDGYLITLCQRQQERDGHVYYNTDEGIALMKSGKNAFLCNSNRGYKLIKTLLSDEQRCALQEIPLLPKTLAYLAMQKGSPLKELFRITAHKITGNGVVQYERKVCSTKPPRCVENEVKMPKVNLDQVSSVLLMLFGAIIGSIVLLVLEIAVSKAQKRRLLPWPTGNVSVPVREHQSS
ncbi:uncharacterized protein LOC128720358 [Anopheles nili]|uniref:uncharacterized protein LOC128720358 n=1 Tax=Anopheles nili TaxID=185578 RepID=UPI00237A15BE|nr:uncharacterized protein LOC128720358 [Anopheles nili]